MISHRCILGGLVVTLLTSAAFPQEAVRGFVRQTFIHGVNWEQASKFGPSDVPVLLTMLEDPKEEPNWANIVTTLGITGDPRVIDPLIRFLEAPVAGTLSRAHYAAKTSVLMALGYAANRGKSDRALAYLRDSLRPEVWAQRNLRWTAPFAMTEQERNRQLTNLAVMGLALSGLPAARELLSSPQARANADQGLINDALEAHTIIARDGMAAYYRAKMVQ